MNMPAAPQQPVADQVWERVRIQGTLTTVTPLAISDGRAVRNGDDRDSGSISTVLVAELPDVGQSGAAMAKHAVIPGSTLRGVLRARAERHYSLDIVNRLFGQAANSFSESGLSSIETDGGMGGKLEVAWSYAKAELQVEHHTTINRIRRTVEERRLFAQEVVPPRTVFKIELLIDQATQEEVNLLASLLDQFNDESAPLSLGGDQGSGRGRMKWTREVVQGVTREHLVRSWQGDSCLQLWDHADSIKPMSSGNNLKLPIVDLRITLEAESFFLVNEGKNSAAGKPDNNPILRDGKIVLPGSSFRGVFRSQCERIARTRNQHAGGDPVQAAERGVIETLFGTTDLRGAISCSDFLDELPAEDVSPKESEQVRPQAWPSLSESITNKKSRLLLTREFVAIDRFTGGAAEHLKFRVVAAWKPVMLGAVRIDLVQLKRNAEKIAASEDERRVLLLEARMVLGWALRDLQEGELAFGYGAAKGLGRVQAEFEREAFEQLLGEIEELARSSRSA